MEKRKGNSVEKKTNSCISKWKRKELILHAIAGVVHFHIYSLRTLPVTTDRLIKTIKLIFDGYTHIPFDIKLSKNELQMLLNAYCQALSPDANEPRIVGGKIKSMENLLMLLRGTELQNLHVYVLSPLFTFCYFLKKHKEDNNLLQEAYQRIKTGNAVISLKQIEEIVGLILPKEKSKLVSLEGLRSVFRKGSSAQMQALLNSYDYLLDEVSEEQEICMKFYFQCFETNSKEVAPSKECHVFYNEDGETLFIHLKKLMTQAEIERFGEEPDLLHKKGIDGNKIINKNDTVNEGPDEVGNRGKTCTDKSVEEFVNKDIPSTDGHRNISIPTNNIETDEARSNLTENPNSIYSNLITNVIDHSNDKLQSREIDKRLPLPVTTSTLSSCINEPNLALSNVMRTQTCKDRTAETSHEPSPKEMSNDESPDRSPLKKKFRVIKNQRKLTTVSSTMESQALEESNSGSVSHTQFSDNPMDSQPPAMGEAPATKSIKNTKESKKK